MKCTKCNGYGYIDNLEGDGLKCPICNGTGEYEPFDTDVELDKLYPTEQNNEAWFDGLSTEEKAEFLAQRDFDKWDNVNSKKESKKQWLVWLKQPHKPIS